MTGFLPDSSSGHPLIGEERPGLTVPGLLFDVAVHLATLASVLIVYRERVLHLFRGALGLASEGLGPISRRSAWRPSPR
jgi:undecaprenyl-diphosphatase